MASRRYFLYCANAYGTIDYPSRGSFCHILCTRTDVHRYDIAYDLQDAPVTKKGKEISNECNWLI